MTTTAPGCPFCAQPLKITQDTGTCPCGWSGNLDETVEIEVEDPEELELRDEFVQTLLQLAGELEAFGEDGLEGPGPDSTDMVSPGGFADRVFTEVIRGGSPQGESDAAQIEQHFGGDHETRLPGDLAPRDQQS